MQAIILCAGFATRMYPLTRNFPKPLLTVAGRPVIDYLVDQVVDLPQVQEVHIVTNARFYDHFLAWRSRHKPVGKIGIHIHNDGATSNDNRLGAAGDLQLALKKIDGPDNLLISAGDNIFRFPIKPLWERFIARGQHHVVALPETDRTKLQRTGVLELEENNRVVRLHEKPQSPPSTWFCPPLYFYQASARPHLDGFLTSPDKQDAPGHFVDYLCRREPVFAFRLNASRLDIGSLDTYYAADRFLTENPLFDPNWDTFDSKQE